LTLSSLVSPFLTADLVFLILHFTRPERAQEKDESQAQRSSNNSVFFSIPSLPPFQGGSVLIVDIPRVETWLKPWAEP
jgi:hypothetical protein